MASDRTKKDTAFYQDVSRITLEGLSEITSEFKQFYEEYTAKFTQPLSDVASHELAEASDQLHAVVEATEQAATKIMDVLEEMQQSQEKIRFAIEEVMSSETLEVNERELLSGAMSAMATCQDGVMVIFQELSFQDLTGQRIKRIVDLVRSIENNVRSVISSLGQKISVEGADPERGAQGEGLLKGPQKKGEGLDQSAIDDLLAAM